MDSLGEAIHSLSQKLALLRMNNGRENMNERLLNLILAKLASECKGVTLYPVRSGSLREGLASALGAPVGSFVYSNTRYCQRAPMSSDTDVMVCPTAPRVGVSEPLTWVEEDLSRGLVTLLVTGKVEPHTAFLAGGLLPIFSRHDGSRYIPTASARNALCTRLTAAGSELFQAPLLQFTTRGHGPAVEMKVLEKPGEDPETPFNSEFIADITLAVEVPQWPLEVSDFSDRGRHWPSQDVVRRITAAGCHLVPKDQLHFWRFSFSDAEGLLSDEFPDAAREALLAAKVMMKRAIKPTCPSLSSYLLKTATFWLLEETEPNSDLLSNQGLFFQALLQNVQTSLQKDQMRHFFLRDVNLVSDMSVEERRTAAELLQRLICESGPDCLAPLLNGIAMPESADDYITAHVKPCLNSGGSTGPNTFMDKLFRVVPVSEDNQPMKPLTTKVQLPFVTGRCVPTSKQFTKKASRMGGGHQRNLYSAMLQSDLQQNMLMIVFTLVAILYSLHGGIILFLLHSFFTTCCRHYHYSSRNLVPWIKEAFPRFLQPNKCSIFYMVVHIVVMWIVGWHIHVAVVNHHRHVDATPVSILSTMSTTVFAEQPVHSLALGIYQTYNNNGSATVTVGPVTTKAHSSPTHLPNTNDDQGLPVNSTTTGKNFPALPRLHKNITLTFSNDSKIGNWIEKQVKTNKLSRAAKLYLLAEYKVKVFEQQLRDPHVDVESTKLGELKSRINTKLHNVRELVQEEMDLSGMPWIESALQGSITDIDSALQSLNTGIEDIYHMHLKFMNNPALDVEITPHEISEWQEKLFVPKDPNSDAMLAHALLPEHNPGSRNEGAGDMSIKDTLDDSVNDGTGDQLTKEQQDLMKEFEDKDGNFKMPENEWSDQKDNPVFDKYAIDSMINNWDEKSELKDPSEIQFNPPDLPDLPELSVPDIKVPEVQFEPEVPSVNFEPEVPSFNFEPAFEIPIIEG